MSAFGPGRVTALLLIAGVVMSNAYAAAGEFGCPHCRNSDKACVLKVDQVDEDETCYEVECEEVCVPPVRFPWESCNTRKCGRVRLVARLKEESRKKKTCSFEWQVVCPRCGRCASPTEAAAPPPTPPAPTGVPMPPAPPVEQTARPARRPPLAFGSRVPRLPVTPVGYNGRSSTR